MSRACGMQLAIAKLAFCALFSSVCNAGDIVFSFSSSNPSTAICCGTYGFQFTPLVNIFLDSFGYLDVGEDGLAASHQVGIWNSSGTLLISAAVSAGTLAGPVLNASQFTYTPISSVLLSAGQTYTIGGEVDRSDEIFFDLAASQSSKVPSLVSVSSSGYFAVDPSLPPQFVDPTSTIDNHYDVVNFTATVAAVPEPSYIRLIAVGFGAVLCIVFRRTANM